MKNHKKHLKNVVILAVVACTWVILSTALVYAESQSEYQLTAFLEDVATFLIRIVGPSILVIGVAMGGIAMATGDERGLRRGIYAAMGGALIMLARSILDLIQRMTGF